MVTSAPGNRENREKPGNSKSPGKNREKAGNFGILIKYREKFKSIFDWSSIFRLPG